IPQAMAMLKERAQTVPAGAWVTAIGDWTPRLFAENRLPTLAELDQAVPNHPVLFATFGPAVTNSLGKKFFESKGIAVARRAHYKVPRPTPRWARCAKCRLSTTKFAARSTRSPMCCATALRPAWTWEFSPILAAQICRTAL